MSRTVSLSAKMERLHLMDIAPGGDIPVWYYFSMDGTALEHHDVEHKADQAFINRMDERR